MQLRNTGLKILLAAAIAAIPAAGWSAQNSPQQAPAAPAAQPLPAAPAAPPAAAPFPAPDPANFTATTPTPETVNDFLTATWGYDPNRIWQVEAITSTQAPSVSRVVVLVAEKGGPKQQTAQLTFFTLPDGQHIISDAVMPFGPKPFAGYREMLRAKATGPSKGASSKDLEFVEFADFQCPHCKDAQPEIARLLADYPAAHFVFEDFPLVQVHSEAFKAASYGVCVTGAGGNDAFFKYADAVFANQDALTPAASDQTLKAAAAKAGQDPAKISACASTPATKAAVNAALQLGEAVGVNSTPMLFVNGRGFPALGIPYPTLLQIINFQAHEDGLSIPAPQPPLISVAPAPTAAAPPAH
jgi:protein-disulfide isomerase